MDSASYLNRILEKMSVTHDIVRDYSASKELSGNIPQKSANNGKPDGDIPQKSAKNRGSGRVIPQKSGNSREPDRDIPQNSSKGRATGFPENQVFPAYAYYASTSEKYVLTQKANLWTLSEYEHVLFLSGSEKGESGELVDYAKQLISDYMEPEFVRKGDKYPPKNHMRSFLTVVLVLEASPDSELIRKIRKYRYDKGYLFSIRGYAQGRLIAVDLPSKTVYTSPAARHVAGFYHP